MLSSCHKSSIFVKTAIAVICELGKHRVLALLVKMHLTWILRTEKKGVVCSGLRKIPESTNYR